MYQRAVFCLAVLIGLTANAQTINVRGKISTQGGARPLPNATVALVGQTLNGNSDTGGAYSIKRTTAVKEQSLLVPQAENISFNNGTIEFYLSQPQSVKVEIFDIKGTLVKKDFISTVPAGVFRYNVAGKQYATNVLVVRASIGANSLTCRYFSGNSANLLQTSSANVVATNGTLAKLAVVADSLRFTANGHTPKTVKISSYDTVVNIILDSVPGPSVGCGKTFATLTSGTYTIKSSGTNRTYIIDIPTNYDKNKPYRLIFGMHCMGGSAAKVSGTDGTNDQTAYYYHIKPLATADNIPCIYVAPQGNSDGTWQGEPDRIYFSDLVHLFKDTLCIDTTRIFCCGFSFGAMFTYALSLEFPKVLRAVACYAPANYHMDQPTNQHLPIGYFQTTGISDNTCPWIYDSTAKQGGKYCLLEHIQDNGGTVPSTIPLATTGKHVTDDFQGCNIRYPVRFCSFQGQHQCNATDPGSSTDWIPVETWTFLKQF
jgi:predicted esterase